MNLEGSVIVVTGASSGIGLAIAHALVREGARVAFAARSVSRLQDEVKRASLHGEAIAVPMDVTSDDSVGAAMEVILARFGRIDVVVNDAGNAGEMSLWAAMGPNAVREMFDVHLLGAERVMRAALPAMRRQRSGTIVNFASTVAWVPMPGAAAYSAAKAAVVALSEALREELRSDGIDVRVFSPPHTSQTFLQRAGLKSEYVEVDPPQGDKADCASCGHHLEILPGARRIVCEKCGHGLDVGGERVTCRGCGAPLAPSEGSTSVTCPHCKSSFQRVQMMRPG